MVSSFALYLMHQGDKKLIMLFLYPRAIEALYSLLVEKGVIRPLAWGGEYLTHMVSLNIITYLYEFEPYNLDKSTSKSFDLYMAWDKDDLETANSIRQLVLNNIRKKYPNHRTFE